MAGTLSARADAWGFAGGHFLDASTAPTSAPALEESHDGYGTEVRVTK
jgi:hypothetical protein